ncbi:MAG: hypothetical protein FWE16_02700 [Firmicutes bacterium]|nr:hypothetical protein [Bacillota bacterium]
MTQKNEIQTKPEKPVSKRVVFKSILCGASVIVSIIMSFILISRGDYPTRDPLSAIGEQNHALFILWGIFTGLAVYFNLKLLASRLNFKSRLFEIALIIGCSMSIVTVTIVGLETWRRIIHISSAMSFGVICVLCVITLVIVKLRCKKNRKTSITYLTAIALSAVIFIFTSINIGWFTAMTQVLVATVCLIIMFCSNFIEKWPKGYSQPSIEKTSAQ